jgi:hypothetical protein
MAGMSDFIAKATTELGIDPGAAQAGTGGLLNLIKTHVGSDVFAKVAQVFPDANTLANAPAPQRVQPAATGGGGGGGLGGALSGLAEKAGGLFGGGKAKELAAALAKSGISADKLPGFVGQFVAFLKSKLPPDLVKTILDKVGALKSPAGV